MGRLIDIAAAIISIGAGVYLLSQTGGTISLGGDQGTSWFEIIAHGMGIYFIAKGLFIARSGLLQARIADSVANLAAYAARDHGEQPGPPDGF